MTERDVVVVGSGHNALVAACYLARAGLSVEVLERDTIIGGAVSTVERFPGIHMDRGSSAHIMVRHTGIIEELELARFGLTYLDMDPWGFVPAPDRPAITLWTDLDRTCASISAACGADDARAYRRFVNDWLPRNRVVFDFFQRPPTLPNLGRAMTSLARLSRGRVRELVRDMLGSADAVLDSYFHDERLKSALAWMSAQSGPPSHEPGTADMLGWLTMLHDRPAGRPVGGSGTLTQSLADRLVDDGSTVSVGDAVRTVERAAGGFAVVLDSGRRITASQVLFGTHVWNAADILSSAAPQASRRLRDKTVVGNGIGMVLRLATSAPPQFHGDTRALAHRSMVLLGGDRTDMRANYGAFLGGRVSESPAALVMCPTVDDDTLAPPGVHTVTIWGQWHPYSLTSESWPAIREREAAKLIDVVERHSPGFRESIIETYIQSPEDIAREIAMPNANVMHLEMTLGQMFSLRPTARDSGYRVHGCDGIYLTGASTHPGGGVFGASGRSASRVMLADRGLTSTSWLRRSAASISRPTSTRRGRTTS